MRHLIGMLGLVAAVSVGIARAQEHEKPTIVLVRGAFAEAASWNSVIAKLQEDGYPVIAAANPLRTAAGDAAAVSALVRSAKGGVVLVGHSYGGRLSRKRPPAMAM